MKFILSCLMMSVLLAACSNSGSSSDSPAIVSGAWVPVDSKITPVKSPQFGPDLPSCGAIVNGNAQLKTYDNQLFYGCLSNGASLTSRAYKIWKLNDAKWRLVADLNLSSEQMGLAFTIKDQVSYVIVQNSKAAPALDYMQLMQIDSIGKTQELGAKIQDSTSQDYADLEFDKSGRLYVGVLSGGGGNNSDAIMYPYHLYELSANQWTDLSEPGFGLNVWSQQYSPRKVLTIDGDELYLAGQQRSDDQVSMSVLQRVSGKWQNIYSKPFAPGNTTHNNLYFSFDSRNGRMAFAYSFSPKSQVTTVTASSKLSSESQWHLDFEETEEDFSGTVNGVHVAGDSYLLALYGNTSPEFTVAFKIQNGKVMMSSRVAESLIGANTLATVLYRGKFLVLHFDTKKQTAVLGEF